MPVQRASTHPLIASTGSTYDRVTTQERQGQSVVTIVQEVPKQGPSWQNYQLLFKDTETFKTTDISEMLRL